MKIRMPEHIVHAVAAPQATVSTRANPSTAGHEFLPARIAMQPFHWHEFIKDVLR
jgi:hypothetical protein